MPRLKRVLLVGDDETSNFLNKLFLEGLDYAEEVYVSQNGEEAICHIKENCPILPDLIFLDINMPIMNGFEFLEEVNRFTDIDVKNIKIVMLTASDRFYDYEKAKKYNVAAYLNKPLTEEKMNTILKESVF